MFLGHFALGLAAKKLGPSVSLGTSFLAAQLPDVIWPVLVLAGVERVTIAPGDTAFTPLRFDSYPISHSLVMVALWGGAFGAVHYARRRRLAVAAMLAGLAISHWVLDFVSHRPDMPLAPGGGLRLGLGLWNSVPATLAVESLMYAAGVALYLSATRPRDRIGRYGFLALVGFLASLYLASAFGPAPPSVTAVGVAAVLGFAIIGLGAAGADRHRGPAAPQ
jgi:hypothetical protein